ncbi:MAG: hypothetical protein JWP49_1402 [Phenylobacterium sp.]|jgi:hypothetical protein|nr:hypothetical protein [Phenylobacterium sp.]
MATRQEKLTGVPAADVDEVMQDFRDAGATFVEKQAEDAAATTYTVTATFA